MRRMAPRSLMVTFVSCLVLATAPAVAQEANPPAPAEPFALPVAFPQAPAGLAVLRVTLQPGEQIPLHPHAALELTFVVAGSATLRIAEGPAVLGVRGGGAAGTPPEEAGPGSELTVAAGDVVIVPPGNVFAARAGSEGVTVLIFGFTTLAGEATPEA